MVAANRQGLPAKPNPSQFTTVRFGHQKHLSARFFDVYPLVSSVAQTVPKTALPKDLFGAIKALNKEMNAVILAHYYQDADIQDIADYLGDSLGLSQQDRKSTRLNSSHVSQSRMPSSA